MNDLHRKSRSVRRSALQESIAERLLEAVADQAALVDEHCVIRHTNEAWREFARQNGAPPTAVGRGVSYLEVCRDSERDPSVALVRTRLAEVATGKWRSWRHVYPCHSPTERRWFLLRAGHVQGGGALVIHTNVTALKLAEQAAEERCARDLLTGVLSAYGLWKVLGSMQASGRDPQVAAIALDAEEFRDAVCVAGAGPDGSGWRPFRAQREGLIQEISRRLRAAAPPGGELARLSEEEFVWASCSLSPSAAGQEAARLRRELRSPIALADGTVWQLALRAEPFVVPFPLADIGQVVAAARAALGSASP